MDNIYYTAPHDLMFNEMKEACSSVWGRYADSPGGYMEEKLARIKDVQNISDNFMYMLAMFDPYNQKFVISKLSQETKEAVRVRMVAGGNDNDYLVRLGL